MITIGMLHYRKSPHKVKKAYACAAVAKMEGVVFVYFSYRAVDFNRKKINGWVYEKGKWTKKEVDFPDVILNISGAKKEFQIQILRQLKQLIPFTSYSVGNKMTVYKKVQKGQEFTDYLIPSYKLENQETVFRLLNKYKRIVLKPFSGNQGRNVMFLEKLGELQYVIIEGEKHETYSSIDVELVLNKLKSEQDYLVQPFIECKTKMGLTYDLRLHVQKNGLGMWDITLIYPRISSNKMISNISSGGFRGELDVFLREEFGEDHFNVKRTLEHFALTFSQHLDSLYKCSFDELGIDVGLDSNKKLWIFEVNWRPGSKHREFEVAKRLVPYAMYLAKS